MILINIIFFIVKQTSNKTMTTSSEFKSLQSFYLYYLTEHSHPTSRRLHFIGTTLFIVVFIFAIVMKIWWLIPVSIVSAYTFAWVGHFYFENNKPATFKYPFYSLASDFIMLFHMLTGQLRQKLEEAENHFSTKQNSV